MSDFVCNIIPCNSSESLVAKVATRNAPTPRGLMLNFDSIVKAFEKDGKRCGGVLYFDIDDCCDKDVFIDPPLDRIVGVPKKFYVEDDSIFVKFDPPSTKYSRRLFNMIKDDENEFAIYPIVYGYKETGIVKEILCFNSKRI
jgi:hypothetical protein